MSELKLLEPMTLGELPLANRIIMAPMTRSRANDEDGVPTDLMATYYAQRASVGLIVTETTSVDASAKGYVRTPGLYNAAQVAGWKKVTDAVHVKGGKIFVQLYHPGRIVLPVFTGGETPVAPSAVKAEGTNFTNEGPQPFVMPRALTTEEIPGIVAMFQRATELSIEAGFDGAELHSASGYLAMQFLSTNTNQRTDQYGGSVENRARFVLEVLAAMTSVREANRVGIKISPEMPFNDIHDAHPRETYTYLTGALSDLGLAYLHVGRFAETDYHALLRPLYKGTFLAGAGLTRETGEALLAGGTADAIVYGSLFIANPDLPARFAQNAPLNTPDKNTFYAPGPEGYTDYPALTHA